MPQSSPPLRRLPALWCAGIALAGPLAAQASVRLPQETAFFKDPGGVRLGTLVAGRRVIPGRSGNRHVEITIRGWVFTRSTRPDKREGFDLSVSAAGGENLRLGPDSAVIGRVVEGTLFTRVATRGGWTQVSRKAWIPESALPVAQVAQAPVRSPPRPTAQPAPRPATDTTPRPAEATPVLLGRLGAGVTLRSAPEGGALATTAAVTGVDVVESNRDWARVRVEGWVRRSDLEGALTPKPAITAAMLRADPDKFVGQTVDWRLQFLAHQVADELRPEMPLGHPYLLARGPLPETGFVYVLLSKDQAERLKGLKPLDEISVMVTVRAGRTRYLATPVVELAPLSGGESRTP